MFRISYLMFKNNIGRYTWPILAVMLAAAIMTGTMTFYSMETPNAGLEARRVFGGDLLVFTRNYVLPAEAERFEYHQHLGLDDCYYLFPEITARGYLDASGGDADKCIAALNQQENVHSVTPSLMLPVKTEGYHVWLRGRNIDCDANYEWEDVVVEGRYFCDEDKGKLVCVLPDKEKHTADYEVGDTIAIQVPSVTQAEGSTSFNFKASRTVQLKVVGVVSTPVQSYKMKVGEELIWIDEDYYWNGILVPEETWQQLFSMAGGRELSFINQYTVVLDDILKQGQTLQQIRREFPQLSVIPLSKLPEYRRTVVYQGAVPFELERPLAIILFVIAAVIIASNMYLAVLQRKRELAVLKAVGATRFNIIVTVVIEVIIISVFGAILGYLSLSWFVNSILLANQISMTYIVRTNLLLLLKIIGVSVALALCFGMIPAGRAANTSCMEVLRDV